MIDFENLRSALVLTDSSELRPTDCWIPGGQALSRAHFISSTERANQQDRIEYLIKVLAPSPLAAILQREGPDLAALDRAVFSWRRAKRADSRAWTLWDRCQLSSTSSRCEPS